MKRANFINMMIERKGHPDTLRVFADWLEEHGECDLAHAYRWAAGRKVWPVPHKIIESETWWLWGPLPASLGITYSYLRSLELAFEELSTCLKRIKEDYLP